MKERGYELFNRKVVQKEGQWAINDIQKKYNWPHDSPFPVPLEKNSSSADRRGRRLSMGMQYLCKAW